MRIGNRTVKSARQSPPLATGARLVQKPVDDLPHIHFAMASAVLCRGCAGLSGYRYSSCPAATRYFKYLFWMYATRRFNKRAICCAESIRHWQNATMAASTVSVAARLPTESTTAMRCPGTFSDSRNCALSEGFHSPCVRLIREGCALHLPLIWGVQRFRFYAHKRLGRSDR